MLPLRGNKRLRERYTKSARKKKVQACTKLFEAAVPQYSFLRLSLFLFTAFLFGYKRKGVNFAVPTGAERLVVGRWFQVAFVHACTYCSGTTSRSLSFRHGVLIL